MRNKLFFLIIGLFSICSCNKTKSDKELLDLDKKQLNASLDYDKILFYKFAKIAIRSNAIQDTTEANYKLFAESSNTLFKTLNNVAADSGKSISAIDALKIYQDYRKVKSFVKETDEDIFPTLLEGFNKMSEQKTVTKPLLKAGEKIYAQNIEHAILSVATLATRSFGQEFALYECSKTKPEDLKDSEEKTLLEFIRGLLFFSNNLFYLSEDGLSRNITWLEKNKQIPLPYTKAIFGWANLNKEQTNTAFHAINCLFRGLARLRMERDIDEERALQDFELFVNDAHQLGLESELVWTVESYLYLKKEQPEKAIVALSKLRNSTLLSSTEKDQIDETIKYLKNRKPDSKLNGLYDKTIMAKVASKYVFSILLKIDWERILKEQDVPYTKEIFGSLKQIDKISAMASSFTNKKVLDEESKDLKEKSKNLLNKAKDILK